MASCFDVVHLENNICVNCKDVKKQGSLRYYPVSTLLAMVKILHALQSLWATLFPFALLWWNVMLYATCAKYYSWNRSRLRLQIAGRHFYGDIVQESCSFSEASSGEEREKSLFSPSCADSSHTENREMSVFSLTCAVEKNDVGSISHQQRKSHHSNHGFGVSIDPCSGLRMLDQYRDACLEESGPHHHNRVAEAVLCESTSIDSKAQAITAQSHTSKLSSLCFLEARRPQSSEPLKGFHWAACSFLSPHQVHPLAMLDVHRCPQIPLDYSRLQVNLHRKGNMLDLTAPMLIDHVSINWPMLREWLQTFNGGCVPVLNCGKKYQDVAWKFTKFSTSRTRNDYAILQFIFSTTEGVNIFNTISPYNVMESVKLRIEEQLCLRDFKINRDFKIISNIAYVDNEDSSSASSEDLGSVCCTSIISDDGCNGMYCTGAGSSLDKDDGFEDSGIVNGKQCYGDAGYCGYYRGYEDIVIASVEDAEDVHGSFVHPDMYEGDGFYDCSARCHVGYDCPHRVTDVDGIPGMDNDAADGDYNNFEDNVEDSGAVCGDFDFAYEDGVYENPLEIRRIHVALKLNTWWDEGAVLVDKQGSEEDSIEQEWQVV